VTLAAQGDQKAIEITALAKVVETTAPGLLHAWRGHRRRLSQCHVAWELYGPEDEDYLF